MTDKTTNLIAKLRYMARQYTAGSAARGGQPKKHYLDEAADELERMRTDAGRYRHIRTEESRNHQHHSKRALVAGICDFAKNIDPHERFNTWSLAYLTGYDLDEAIDEAIDEATGAIRAELAKPEATPQPPAQPWQSLCGHCGRQVIGDAWPVKPASSNPPTHF